MYFLKRVYAILSFENNRIKLLVLERQNDKQNCLYFNEIKLEYLDNNYKFFNATELQKSVQKLTKSADEFLGINIKRYILNIGYLPLKTNASASPTFLLFNQILSNRHYLNYINKVKNQSSVNDEYVLEISPTSWNLDNKKSTTFPNNLTGNEISFQYNSLSCSREIINQFIDLLDSIKIRILKITSNSLCLSKAAENDSNYAVVDIKNNITTINFYNASGKIVYVSNIPCGSWWILNEIRIMLEISHNINIIPTINALRNLELVNDQTPIINIHSKEFLVVKEGFAKDMFDVIKIVNNKFFKIIDENIAKLQSKLKVKISKIDLNVCDDIFAMYQQIDFFETPNHLSVELLKNSVIGLEEYNICNMLGAIEYTYDKDNINDDHTYSIDPYISQEASEEEIKQGIRIKLGLISTKVAAKLGE